MALPLRFGFIPHTNGFPAARPRLQLAAGFARSVSHRGEVQSVCARLGFIRIRAVARAYLLLGLVDF